MCEYRGEVWQKWQQETEVANRRFFEACMAEPLDLPVRDNKNLTKTARGVCDENRTCQSSETSHGGDDRAG